MPSKYTRRRIWTKSWKQLEDMTLYKMAPAFLNPNGMNLYANVSQGVVMAVFTNLADKSEQGGINRKEPGGHCLTASLSIIAA